MWKMEEEGVVFCETVGSRGRSVLAGRVRSMADVGAENRWGGWVACDGICEGETGECLSFPQSFLKKLKAKVRIVINIGQEKWNLHVSHLCCGSRGCASGACRRSPEQGSGGLCPRKKRVTADERRPLSKARNSGQHADSGINDNRREHTRIRSSQLCAPTLKIIPPSPCNRCPD